MTIDEAIAHARDVASVQKDKCEQCAKDHEQLAEWLEELQALREKLKEKRNDDISFEGFYKKIDDWYKDGEMCDVPIEPQYALDLIFKTLVDDKENYPYLTNLSESTEQTNSIMLDILLKRYSRKYRKFRKKRYKYIR